MHEMNRLPQPSTARSCSPATSFASACHFHPSLLPLLHHLQTRLCPLVSSTTGLGHPDFPANLLAYHLLTSSQLDSLAAHFHQVWPPVAATTKYPVRIRPWLGCPEEEGIDLATKRRRFGRFIGLRGCESPVKERGFFKDPLHKPDDLEQMLQSMEGEWQAGLARVSEHQGRMREKR